MYHYYQTGEKSSWVPIPLTPNVEQAAIDLGAIKLTILAVSEIVGEDTEGTDLQHKGPLYFDIDNKDISEAIRSANELVNKLKDMGVPEGNINAYASGGKGFHIIIPSVAFSSGRPMKKLNEIYKEMALELYVIGMDFQVYSGSRGNCWRIQNIKRPDGNYRVRVRLSELEEMTEDGYRSLVKNPRDIGTQRETKEKCPALVLLFDKAKKKVKSHKREQVAVDESALRPYAEDHPQCILDLADYKIKGSTNFNQAAMQLAAFAVRSGAGESGVSSVISRMASNSHSTAYSTTRSRSDHLVGLIRYAGSSSKVKFSCPAIRSVLSSHPCDECGLKSANLDEDDIAGSLGIIEKEDGYYLTGGDEDRRISTFVLEPVATHVEIPQSGGMPRRVGTMIDIVKGGETLGTFMFDEGGWSSKSGLISEVKGINGVSFLGSDADVQRIKYLVFKEGREMGEVTQVHTAGIHYQKVAGRDIMVYVEPGYSVNQVRATGTHTIAGKVPAAPKIRDATLPDVGDSKVSKALESLMEVNSPEVVAQILGWFCASHLKLHIMRRYSQFPILSIWGNAGSGKSMTATLFAWLNGCDYTLEDSPVSLASITPWAMLHYCSSTTTAPRLLDEYNKSKMAVKSYDFCGEVMKSAWGGQVIARGTISNRSNANGRGRGGADVMEIPISGPLVVMSEQAPQMPALQQRSVQILLTRQSRKDRDEFFEDAMASRESLRCMSRALVFSAITTPVEWVEEKMTEYKAVVPKELTDRPRFSYQVLLLGLDFLKDTMIDLSLEAAGKIDRLKECLIAEVQEQGENIRQSKQRTEVDAVLEDVGIMAAMSKSGENYLVDGVHYMIVGTSLLLDLPIIHAVYKRYKRSMGESVVIESSSQFASLIRQEPFFENDKEVCPEMVSGRTVYRLGLDEMVEKGHDVELFR